MKRLIVLAALLAMYVAGAVDTPEAWQIVMSSNAVERAVFGYTNNVVRAVWAGDEPGSEVLLPANASFHFAIAGDRACVSNVQRVLDATVAAIQEPLRDKLIANHLLAPTMQWFVRFIRGNSTNPSDYLKSEFHPVVFHEADFNPTNLPLFAGQLRPQDIPPTVAVEFVEEVSHGVASPKTQAGVDYPGLLPELMFGTPFGSSFILRAPEGRRAFRFKATSWPNANFRSSFEWRALTPGVSVRGWNAKQTPKEGFAILRIDGIWAYWKNRRIDVAVFAKGRNGLCGAPTILSFYPSPYEQRRYGQTGGIQEIRYTLTPREPLLYDYSPIFTPADWTDEYECVDRFRVFRFKRRMPAIDRAILFSNIGEVVLETHPNATPKVSKKVRYFVDEKGFLQFEGIGNGIKHKLESFQPNLRGE